ncbi:MAG TPA: hypothetical protein PKW95_02960 [bacterium]|nr:hypothetical protein [bacterium]
MKQKPISNLDALGALFVGAWVRFGAPVVSVGLQILAVLLGAAAILMILWNKVVAVVALFPAALALWYFGWRIGRSFGESTLDRAKEIVPRDRA